MPDNGEVILRIVRGKSDDTDDLQEAAGYLRGELLELDVFAVEPVPGEAGPAGAKGAAAIVGWLAVRLGSETLKVVLAHVAEWVTRNDRAVEVVIDGDMLKLTGITREQQEKVIDAWLAHRQSGS
jgi:hypothetical protein